MIHTGRRYMSEFKAAAVRELKKGRSIETVAAALKVNRATLYHWLREAERTASKQAAPAQEPNAGAQK